MSLFGHLAKSVRLVECKGLAKKLTPTSSLNSVLLIASLLFSLNSPVSLAEPTSPDNSSTPTQNEQANQNQDKTATNETQNDNEIAVEQTQPVETVNQNSSTAPNNLNNPQVGDGSQSHTDQIEEGTVELSGEKIDEDIVKNNEDKQAPDDTRAENHRQGNNSLDDFKAEQSNPQTPDNSGLSANEHNRLTSSLRENPWVFLHAYNASYDIYSDGDRLGSASRNMLFEDGNWKLQVSTKLKKWMLTLKSREFSKFVIQNNKLFTNEFFTSTKISFKSERKVEQSFDWQQKMEAGKKGKRNWQLPLDQHLYDRMSHLVKLRSDLLSGAKDFNYIISYKGKRKTYSYQITGDETIITPMGEINTIRLDRISGDDSRFSLWLSPEYNYFPIKIAQVEQDKPDVVLTLNKLEFVTPKDDIKQAAR
ncbi:DUF3108 domain-containing protein [Aliikangiella coralliicola]|uniref:DUF3108 domain-containing protein n=1 Tax=Aliikangiella coralliicola TaxID=2592383 RepID=A0A545U4Z9_9GAMM|nr:DUF3108 domain-containing protein [Aliikangiella coralliicola]TQV84524.1 DUF3108 domain-containing protein [Aliikangiella coralliicola]